MYVCVYNFYLNKLFKLFILLKEIILIIKIHIQCIQNICNLFSKFYYIYIYIYTRAEPGGLKGGSPRPTQKKPQSNKY